MKYTVLILSLFIATACAVFAGEIKPMKTMPSPHVFIENKGQWPQEVQFLAQTGGMNAWVTKSGIRYDFYVLELKKPNKSEQILSKTPPMSGSIHGNVVDMEFVGGHAPQDSPSQLHSAYYNYFIGTDRSKWASNVALYGEVTRREIYKGIDARFYFEGGYMRYDMNVGVSSNPEEIAIKFMGAEGTEVNRNGELVLHTSVGEVVHQKLVAYQEINGEKRTIECSFIPKGHNIYGFRLASYDHSKPLVIDPIVYSMYLGGSQADYGKDLGLDPQGNVVAVGTTMSTVADRFPIKDGIYTILNAPTDIYVTKMKADLSDVIFSTYYGSSAGGGGATGEDEATCCAVDNITGVITFGGAVRGIAPGAGRDNSYHGMQDAFMAKINANGSGLICGTNIGGAKDERVNDLVTVPFTGEVVVVGSTSSIDFPTTSGVIRPTVSAVSNLQLSEGFVTKLSSNGAGYLFSTYIGIDSAYDYCNGVALDKDNSIVVVGTTCCDKFPPGSPPSTKVVKAFLYGRGYRQNNSSTNFNDGFMIKLSTNGKILESGTLIGGDKFDECTSVDVDHFGYAVICGNTQSTDLGANQFDRSLGGTTEGFAMRINIAGENPNFITYLGGSGDIENMTNIKYFDQTGASVICGYSNSPDFPTGKVNEFAYKGGGAQDGVLIQLKSDGTNADYTTFLGGSNFDDLSGVVVNSVGTVYVTGTTTSNDFPMAPPTTPSFNRQIVGLYDAVVLAINTCSVTLQAPKDTSVCAFVPLTLSNSATGTGAIRFNWVDESASSTTVGTNPDLTFTPTVSTRIILTVTDDNCSKQVVYSVNVKPIPIILTVEEKRACIGTALTLTSVAGDSKNTIAWYDALSSTTPLSTGGTYTTPALTKSVTYYVESIDTSTKCTSGRKAINITVVPVPSSPTIDNAKQCAGSPATLSAILPSDVNFRWYDAPTGGNLVYVGRTFTTPTVINTTTSYYLETLDTTTNCTSVSRTEAKVIILPSPQPIISGQNAACTNSSGLKYSVPSKPNRSYAWSISPNGTITAGNGSNQVTVSWTSIGSGLLSITEKDLTSGCTKDTNYVINISNELSSTILTSGNTSFCSGDSIVLDAGAGYSSYKWSSGETSQTITVRQSGSFSVAVSDASGCKGKSNTLDITVSPKPNPVISGQNTVCVNGKPFSYSVPNTAGTIYQWSVSPEGIITSGDGSSTITVNWISSGTATIKITETGGVCSKDTSFSVVVSSSLTPLITAQSKTSLCEGESVILDAGNYASTIWSSGEQTRTITVNKAGTYTVDVEDAGGCKGKSQPITVTVSALPTPIITSSGKLDFCEGDSVILDAGQYAQYTWSTGAKTQKITVTSAGNYNVSVVNASGCTGVSGSENVTVYPLPVASTITQQGDDSLLAFGIQSGNLLQWKFNGIAVPGATGTALQATQDGNYTVETTSSNGCVVTSMVFGYSKPSSAVLTVAVSPKTISGVAGETVKVPLVITSSKNLSQATASSFSAELLVDPTVLIPSTGSSTIDNQNRRIITVNGSRTDGNDTLIIVELKAGLGSVEVSPIVLKSLTFTSGKAQVTTVDGEFQLLGLCKEGAVRLFKSVGAVLSVASEPNPTSDVLNITIGAAEVGEHKVYITNTLGGKQREVYRGEIIGTQVLTSSVGDLPAGVYFLCVQSPTEMVVRRIVIAK